MTDAARDRDRVAAFARELGFAVVGFASAEPPLGEEYARYRDFLAQDLHGEMNWLAENAAVRERVDTSDILAGARSVVCVARRYDRSAADEACDAPFAQRIARYARGRDYHNGVRKKLRQLAAFLRRMGTSETPVHARPMCDDAPVLERAWAARAGLGFIGKNGLLIAPGVGSFVLLGEVVTTLALPPDEPMRERCGSCRACLDACPTNAFAAPFVLDPRKCISYLTIEKRTAIDDALASAMEGRVFGCDTCQDVCPFNRPHAQRTHEAPQFLPHARWSDTTLEDWLVFDAARFAEAVRGSPLHRATRVGMARNAAIALGHRGDEAARAALAQCASQHDDAMVRDTAARALAHLGTLDPANIL